MSDSVLLIVAGILVYAGLKNRTLTGLLFSDPAGVIYPTGGYQPPIRRNIPYLPSPGTTCLNSLGEQGTMLCTGGGLPASGGIAPGCHCVVGL